MFTLHFVCRRVIIIVPMIMNEYAPMLLTLKARLGTIDAERAELDVRRSELDNEAMNIKATIAKLLPLCGETADPNDVSGLGFTDAVRQVIYLADKALSPAEVKEELSKKGFELSIYSSPMASIYKILSRLKDNDEVDTEMRSLTICYKKKPRHRVLRTRSRRREQQG